MHFKALPIEHQNEQISKEPSSLLGLYEKNSPVKGWGALSKKSKCQKNEPSIN